MKKYEVKIMVIAFIVLGASLLALTLFLFIGQDNIHEIINEKKHKLKSRSLIDYDIYIMTRKEKLIYILIASIIIYIIAFIFYRSHIISSVLIPFSFLYPKIKTKEIIDKRKNELNLQFKEAIYALASSLSAGKSIEVAFKDSLKDIKVLYPDPDTYIVEEFRYIIRRLDMNETIEEVLSDFAARAHLEDVNNFVDAIVACKRTGGNVVEIIKNTSNVITDKIHIKHDIEVLLAEKKFEQKLLNIIPIGLILILSCNAKDYMEPVFQTAFGKAMMTISVILLIIAYVMSKKIMDIEV
ncbi:type II secretion system F family protein [Paramaledivibacter caminithermalis]|nr:type II secretion system F family protein [Paramaledivibacter caminithermalis]